MIYAAMRRAIASLLPKIYEHPFNQQLFLGTLPREKFNAFLDNDQFYLRHFAQVLKKLAERFEDTKNQHVFLTLSEYISTSELQLHRYYLRYPNKPIQIAPSVSSYINYLHKTIDVEPLPIAVSCCLPCFGVYSDVGLWMKQQGIKRTSPYFSWGESYSSEKFLLANELIIHAVNELALTEDEIIRHRMIQAFIKSTHYEMAFWDNFYEKTLSIEPTPSFSYSHGFFKKSAILVSPLPFNTEIKELTSINSKGIS